MRKTLTFLLIPFCLTAAVISAAAQSRAASTTYYPDRLYRGANIITISNERGIDRISFRATRNITVTVPRFQGCPTSVDVSVELTTVTTRETVDFTVFDCDGRFVSTTIPAEDWTILHENTGNVFVGRDTCLKMKIQSPQGKEVDSIVVSDSRFRVVLPPRPPDGKPYVVHGGIDFSYTVCFQATEPDTVKQVIQLYIRRGFPNGGLTQYIIEKPITAMSVPPPPTPERLKPSLPEIPPLRDPTTFRNIIMPTAESVEEGKYFLGSYDIVGILAGYGVLDRTTILLGGAYVPSFVTRVFVGTAGAKYEVVRSDEFRAAVGYQYGVTSTVESDITASTPYLIASLGNHQRRISLAVGYTWKQHSTPIETFDRNAVVLALGGDVTVGRGWKIAAETYYVESSGLVPLAFTVRRFTEKFAVDVGVGFDFSNIGDVQSTGTFTGEISNLRVAPIVSAIWVW